MRAHPAHPPPPPTGLGIKNTKSKDVLFFVAMWNISLTAHKCYSSVNEFLYISGNKTKRLYTSRADNI